VSLPPGQVVHVDVVDTWNMTVDRLPGTFEETFTVPLPARQYMALRLIHDPPALHRSQARGGTLQRGL
jgi:hypothetical protein